MEGTSVLVLILGDTSIALVFLISVVYLISVISKSCVISRCLYISPWQSPFSFQNDSIQNVHKSLTEDLVSRVIICQKQTEW